MVYVENELPVEYFVCSGDEAVANAYGQIMLWVQRDPRYFDYAKARSATGADGRLLAYAMAKDMTVVTNRQPAAESRRETKLPAFVPTSACPFADIFLTLHTFGARYEWRGPG